MREIEIQYIPEGVSGYNGISDSFFSDSELQSIKELYIASEDYKPVIFGTFCGCETHCWFMNEEVDTFSDGTCVKCGYYAEKKEVEFVSTKVIERDEINLNTIVIQEKQREVENIEKSRKEYSRASKSRQLTRISKMRELYETLEKNNGHRTNTAKEMGISHRTLRNRIKKFEEDKEELGMTLEEMELSLKVFHVVYFEDKLIGTASGVDKVMELMLVYDKNLVRRYVSKGINVGKYRQFRFEEK